MKTATTPLKTTSGALVKQRWAPIKNGRGDVKGYIEMFWSNGVWMTIPGVSGYRNAA